MKRFDIPEFYKSNLISNIKELRRQADRQKKDMRPTILKFDGLEIVLARHFGFCFGVENAVEIAYKTIENNKGKRIFLLSQMIHNPIVNEDLESYGLRFIQDTHGKQLIPWTSIQADDIVIIPAFGVSVENKKILEDIGVDLKQFDTTCPFVERVWKKSSQIGEEGYTVIVHGKAAHEETKATFSRACLNSPTLMLRDQKEAEFVARFIQGKESETAFKKLFEGRHSKGFNPTKDLVKIGVVNQTTMLASETQEIADILKQAIFEKRGEAEYKNFFAETRDTLCYATNDNQSATLSLLSQKSDLAIVVGGKNSSNTSHIVELLEEKFKTVFIEKEEDISEGFHFQSYNLHAQVVESVSIKSIDLKRIILTSGASCPDVVIDNIIQKLLKLKGIQYDLEAVEQQIIEEYGLIN